MSVTPDETNVNASNVQIAQEDFAEKVSQGLTTFTSGTALVVIGFAVGALILLFDYLPFRSEDSLFLKAPPFQLFLLATIAQTVFWAVAFGSMWPSLRTLSEYRKGHVPENSYLGIAVPRALGEQVWSVREFGQLNTKSDLTPGLRSLCSGFNLSSVTSRNGGGVSDCQPDTPVARKLVLLYIFPNY